MPLVNVDADGSISVQGSSSYSLYLNGRPYEMAQTSPKVFLESLPASSIKKVEVITHPDNRFGADSQRYILNIVLKQPMLEGYVVNLSAGGNTQPTANGSLMGMIKKNKVDASINYTYNLNGQRHQPTDITYTEKDEKGDITHIWRNDGKGNGDWHTHTVRAMLKWEIDSLNTLYADAHGQILQTNITDSNIQSEGSTSGRLNVSVTANSPFIKYNHSRTITSLPTMITEQNNYMTARSFGINLSYSFGGGQKIKIDRDRTLDSTDQNTGVK